MLFLKYFYQILHIIQSSVKFSLFLDTQSIKRKQNEIINGNEVKNKKMKKKSTKDEDDDGETFYCPKCDLSFESLTEHTQNYHQNCDVLVQVNFL